jgi:hypothetical protein
LGSLLVQFERDPVPELLKQNGVLNVLALKARAPPTTANTAIVMSVIFAFFMIRVLFESKS